ncbi:MAG TPA: hypothetical protein VL614_29760 [Acetobacteraceae bacterium]|jgi:hypothetical protein|nr:hypothetical protein [Acetobacteraceae bacterium]
MQAQNLPFNPAALDAFVALVGEPVWRVRIADIVGRAASGPRLGQEVRQRHGLELAIERLRRTPARPPTEAELRAAQLANYTVALYRRLGVRGKARLRQRIALALTGDETLLPLFHLLRNAELQQGRGFEVSFAGLDSGAPFDLLISRGSVQAEVVCDVISAEEGRLVHRRAWSHLTDLVAADLRDWLPGNPGRYLLKLTVAQGLRLGEAGALEDMRLRISRLLHNKGRRDDNGAAVLRLDPLILAHPVDEPSLLNLLRADFGPEAHLAVTTNGASIFAMAARAGRVDEVAVAVRERLAAIAPDRLTGQRPGILAMFVEDTDRREWRGLRDRLELEGEARQFLAGTAARPVIAVTCASRCEMFGMPVPHAAEDGELRFRNPAHPAAKAAALAPAVLSSV